MSKDGDGLEGLWVYSKEGRGRRGCGSSRVRHVRAWWVFQMVLPPEDKDKAGARNGILV